MSGPPEAAGLAASAGTAATGVLVLVAGLALVAVAARVTCALVPRPPEQHVVWRFLHVLAALALVLAGATLVGGALAVGAPQLHELLLGQVATAAGLAGAVLLIAVLVRRRDPQGLRSLGLRSAGNLRATAAGLVAYLLCTPALIGTMLAWPWVYERLGGTWTQQPIVTRIGELGPAGVALMVVLAVLVQPILEEVLFRSFVQPLCVQSLGARGGIVATSVLFAVLHGGSAFLPVFGLSLLLGALMLRTQRLAAVGVVHALHNGVMLLLVFLAPEVGGTPADPSSAGLVSLPALLP